MAKILKIPTQYLLRKVFQGCVIFYHFFRFSVISQSSANLFFFIVFPDDFSFIFSSSLITQAFSLHFQEILFQIIFSAITKVPICGKSGMAFYKTEFWTECSDKVIRKSLQKVLCCALTFPGVQLIFEVSELCFVKDPPIQ